MTKWTWIELIDYLQKLKVDINQNEPTARFRIAAYERVIKKIMQFCDLNAVTSRADIERLNLTEYMREKLIDIIRKKPQLSKKMLSPIIETVGPPKVLLEQQLVAVPGIGIAKARELITAGVKRYGDLLKTQWFQKLSEESQAHLLYTPLVRIPHEKIQEIEPILTDFEGAQLVGSYRRKQSYSSDIDVMLVSDNLNRLDEYLDHLREHFKVWVYSHGNAKMSLILAPKKRNLGTKETYKTDVFRCGIAEYPATLLYSTGSKFFNIRIRNRAKRMGYLLNQNGLFDGSVRLNLPDEKSIFEALDMEYLEPFERK